MSIHHFDANHVFIQSILPDVPGGYSGMEAQADCSGGFAGAFFDLARGTARAKIRTGHLIEWWINGVPVYVGVVTGNDKTGQDPINLNGVVREWASRTPYDNDTFGGNVAASVAMAGLVVNEGPGALLSTSTVCIDTSSYNVVAQQQFRTVKLQAVIDLYNSFEGWEWGGFIPAPGHTLADLTTFFYRAPDLTTMHYLVDVSMLKDRPKLSEDREKFGNKIRVYYGSPHYALDVTGTAASIAKYGTIWAPAISLSATSTAGEATQAGQKYLGGLMVDGVETPPVSTEITLTYASKLRAINGAQRDIYSIVPGQNILVTGLTDVPRTLTAVNNQSFFHINTVKWTQSGEVTLSVGRSFDPAVLLARLKGAAA